MALYTRKWANISAGMASRAEDYLIIVEVTRDFKSASVLNIPREKGQMGINYNKPEESTGIKVVMLGSEEVRKQFAFSKTVKDLEVIFYQLINKKIEYLRSQAKANEKSNNRATPWTASPEIYCSDVGYNRRLMRFYVKVRETDKSIWLQRIGKRQIGGDVQNPLVTANPTKKDGEVIRRSKRDSGSVKIGEYEYANLWDGKPIQEYSD